MTIAHVHLHSFPFGVAGSSGEGSDDGGLAGFIEHFSKSVGGFHERDQEVGAIVALGP